MHCQSSPTTIILVSIFFDIFCISLYLFSDISWYSSIIIYLYLKFSFSVVCIILFASFIMSSKSIRFLFFSSALYLLHIFVMYSICFLVFFDCVVLFSFSSIIFDLYSDIYCVHIFIWFWISCWTFISFFWGFSFFIK